MNPNTDNHTGHWGHQRIRECVELEGDGMTVGVLIERLLRYHAELPVRVEVLNDVDSPACDFPVSNVMEEPLAEYEEGQWIADETGEPVVLRHVVITLPVRFSSEAMNHAED